MKWEEIGNVCVQKKIVSEVGGEKDGENEVGRGREEEEQW